MEFYLLLLQTLIVYRAIFGDILSQSHSKILRLFQFRSIIMLESIFHSMYCIQPPAA